LIGHRRVEAGLTRVRAGRICAGLRQTPQRHARNIGDRSRGTRRRGPVRVVVININGEGVVLVGIRLRRFLRPFLTAQRVHELLPQTAGLPVEVHQLPNLRAVNIVVHGLLGRGVAENTSIDPQAKGLGEYLRSRLVDVPVHLLPRSS